MGIIAEFLDMDEGWKYYSTMLNSGGRYIIEGKDFPEKCGQNYVNVKEKA